MGRRSKGIAAAVLLALAGGAMTAEAAAVNTPYIAEQAVGKAPNVEVYMTGSKMNENVEVGGTMDSIAFTQNGGIVSFEESGEGLAYIILMDNSGSVNEAQFEETKNQLVQLRKSLKEGDAMTLYTVGTDNSGGEKTEVFARTVGGDDKKAKNRDCKQIRKIEYLKGASSKTVLYRSLNQVLKEQATPEKRTVVLLITDGEDDSEGKDIDHVSTANTVKEAAVPVYGIVLNRKPSKSGNGKEQDEKISYTRNEILAEKNCRGYYHDCSVDATEESVRQAFEVIRQLLLKETYVVKLAAPTNQALGKTKLALTADNMAVDAVTVDYSAYEEDQDAPVIVGNVEEVGGSSITFSLQDKNGINLSDVNETANYMVQSLQENGEGKVWTVESVNAAAKGNEVAITLTMTETLFNDSYVLKCTNIRDKSQDENEMDASTEFQVVNGVDKKDAAVKEMVKSYWWTALILLVVIIGVLIIFAIRRKKVEMIGVLPDDLSKADTRKIWLTITDRTGAIKDVEWNVEGSLFVGRSDICNIFFDDDRLSKQHFVVEVNKMGCYIEDLESTNGTYVNGVKLTNRRMLLDEDMITAGREKFVFHIPKQQLADQG